jgi:hypothetical protein
VDAILNDTERIIGHMDAALAGKKVALLSPPPPLPSSGTGGAAKRKADELDIASIEGATTPTRNGVEALVVKRKPTVQCEECYEVFEDSEKLAWHALNDH